jgi:YVTN family beta-propeller protein
MKDKFIAITAVASILMTAVACSQIDLPIPVAEETTPAPVSPGKITIPEASPIRCLFPSDVESTPDGSRIYVSCYGSDNVLVIDTATNEVTGEIDLSEAGPYGLSAIDAVMTPDGQKLFLADDFTGKIGVVDITMNQVVAVVDVSEWWPTGKGNRIAVSPDGRFVYAALESNQVPVIDIAADTVVKVVNLETPVYLAAFSPDGTRAYFIAQAGGGRVYIVDTSTYRTVGRIDLGLAEELQTQGSVAVSPDGKELYLTSGFNAGGYEHPEIGVNRVFVIDIPARALVDEIEVIGGPHRMHLSADGRLAYVSTADARAVFVLDLVNRSNLGMLDWDEVYQGDWYDFKKCDLRGIAILPDDRSAYLVGWDGDVIYSLDLLEQQFTGAIDLNPMVGAAPADIILTVDGSKAYVTTTGEFVPGTNNGVLVIDTQTNSVVSGIVSDGAPRRMAISEDGSLLYVASDPVLIIDTHTDEILASVFLRAGSTVHDVVPVPTQNKLYASYGEKTIPGRIAVIDLSSYTVVNRLDVGWFPVTMVASLDGSRLYVNRVLNPNDVGELVVIDTATDQIVETIASPIDTPEEIGPIGAVTCGLAISPDGDYVYWVAGWQYINIVETATNTIIKTLELAPALPGIHVAPSAIAFTSDGSRAYIACWDAGYVVIVDTETWEFLDIIKVGFRPGGIDITPDDRFAYVTNRHSEDVYVIDLATNEVVDTILLGLPQ